MSSDSERKGGLDLGLSALLQDPAGVPSEPIAAPTESHVPSPPSILPAADKNEFETLAAESRWGDLVALCEQKMSTDSQDLIEPRLWWVTAQLRSGQLPVSLLVAPLEAATQSALVSAQDSRIRSLAAGTLASAAAAARAAADGELEVAMLHKAAELDPHHQAALTMAVDAEVSRLRSQSGLSTAQLSERESRVAQLESLRPVTKISPEARVIAMVRSASSPQASKRGSLKSARRADCAPGRSQTSPKRFLGALAVIGLSLGAWWFLGRGRIGFSADQQGMLLAGADSDLLQPQLKLAEIPQVEMVSAFDGLYYDLKNEAGGKGGKARLSRPVASGRGPSAQSGSGSKQMLVIDGPTEPPEMQDALLQPEEPPADKSSATLFGGADATVPDRDGGSGQVFTGHQIFKVLVRTKIMAHPQYQTEALGMLNAGDRVSAEGQVDSWLKIRSTSGRVGFILAQDVAADAS